MPCHSLTSTITVFWTPPSLCLQQLTPCLRVCICDRTSHGGAGKTRSVTETDHTQHKRVTFCSFATFEESSARWCGGTAAAVYNTVMNCPLSSVVLPVYRTSFTTWWMDWEKRMDSPPVLCVAALRCMLLSCGTTWQMMNESTRERVSYSSFYLKKCKIRHDEIIRWWWRSASLLLLVVPKLLPPHPPPPDSRP